MTGSIGHLVCNDLDAANAHFAVLTTAGAAMLEPRCGRDASAGLVSCALNEPFRDDILAGTRAILDVRRRLFHDVLVALGRPDLQAILCRFDLNWADAVEPERHGAAFIRPVTYSCGERCRMVFSRVERPAAYV